VAAPKSVTTTTEYYPPQGLGQILGGNNALPLVLAALGVYYFFLRPQQAPQVQPSSQGVPTPTSSTLPPPPGPPGTPDLVQALGETAHSVVVETNPVEGALYYEWYEYPTDILLARSPTNIAVIEGLQSNTDYQVFPVAVGYDGQMSAPGPVGLIRTEPGSPIVNITEQVTPATTTTTTQPSSSVQVGTIPAPYQTTPTPAATSVFQITTVNAPSTLVPGQHAYADVTVRNVGSVAAGTTVYGYMREFPGIGPILGHFSPEDTGVIQPGQSVTITLRSANVIASPRAIPRRLVLVFYTKSGSSAQTIAQVGGA